MDKKNVAKDNEVGHKLAILVDPMMCTDTLSGKNRLVGPAVCGAALLIK